MHCSLFFIESNDICITIYFQLFAWNSFSFKSTLSQSMSFVTGNCCLLQQKYFEYWFLDWNCETLPWTICSFCIFHLHQHVHGQHFKSDKCTCIKREMLPTLSDLWQHILTLIALIIMHGLSDYQVLEKVHTTIDVIYNVMECTVFEHKIYSELG